MNVMRDIFAENPVLRDMWRDIQRVSDERAVAAAKADPEKHKLSSLLAPGVSSGDYYRYAVGRDGHKATVYWCFMQGPNVAGYYLTWRERVTGKTLRRTHRRAWKTIGRAETEALRRYRRERVRLNKKNPAG